MRRSQVVTEINQQQVQERILEMGQGSKGSNHPAGRHQFTWPRQRLNWESASKP